MYVLISGTNRPGNMTVKLARLVNKELERHGVDVHFVDLQELPPALFTPEAYANKPPELAAHQEAILACRGVVTVVPEYNGSYPGVLKYFIDMLKFPESLVTKPACFVGLAAGQWGARRAVEQLEMVYQYRCAHLFGERVFVPAIYQNLDEQGQLTDPALKERLSGVIDGFVHFAESLALRADSAPPPVC